MRIEITAVHRHDAFASVSRDFIGTTGEANWSAKTPGIPAWFGVDFTPDDETLGAQQRTEAGNTSFFACKFKELP